jgi:hypothetical protein
MKKIVFLYFLFFTTVSSFAQTQGDVTLLWTEKKILNYGSFNASIPQFNAENFQYNPYNKTIQFGLTFKTSFNVNENQIEIKNLVFEPITESQLGDLAIKEIPSSFKYSFENKNARDVFYGKITLNPIIKEGNSFKKLISFTYSIGQNSLKNNYATNSTVPPIGNSVLSSGNWYRFYVQKSGVYKITKGFLQSLGLNTNVDPRKIKIYGNGGRMLPLLNATSYPMDLAENAIQFIGESDGVFDDQDYILFYAEGMDNWNDDYKSNINIYADKSYYYITSQGNEGKRIPDAVQPSGSASSIINTFDDYQFHEVDNVNIAKLGRMWFGESFSINNSQTFNFKFPNIVASSPLQTTIHVGIAAFTPTSFKVEINNQTLTTMNLTALAVNTGVDAIEKIYTGALNATTEDVAVKITYDNNGVPTSNGYLDFIRIKAKRNLQGYGKQFRFQYDQASSLLGVGEFQVSNATTITQVWDITDMYNATKIDNAGQNAFSFKANLGEVRKYIAVDKTDYYLPLKESRTSVDNQNLKNDVFKNSQGQFQDVDYLIITPKFLNAQAEKLANFHRSYSHLNVKVVNLETIYPEFSSGKQDIGAIRNFIKYVYFNASSPDKKVKYVNLFGDASYDFKDRVPNNTNTVPIYQALNSFTETEFSFASDDFYGMMDDSEGRLDSGTFPTDGSLGFNYSFGGIDIAVGRMIVSSTEQAEEMVNKVIEYHDVKSYGSWRNSYVAIADDPDALKPGDAQLQFYQNRLADKIATEKPFINVEKILLDSYQQETAAGGKRYPKARQEIFAAFEKGALVFNYLGHGGEDGLSEERIWEKSDGQNLKNQYKYPLFITITCDFSKFDNPYRPTAGEYTYWNPKGGAISMVTTIRSIGQGAAQNFNDKLAEYLFAYGSGTEYTSIAEALRLAKTVQSNSATNVVFYLGDPALMLAIPKPKIVLTKVNDLPVTGPIDDFKALSFIKLSGQILDENNNVLSNYNGNLSTTVFDKNITANTLRNDGVDAMISASGQMASTMPFTALGETIFRGNASVSNGNFEFGFVVPRDIRIPLGNGKISFYAKRNEILLDKTGFNTDIKIGGTNTNAAVDITPPKVKVYMNDVTFVNGGITNASPFFLAKLEDEHGINTASGIGHDIIGILDGNETKPYIMNDYYETELNDYTKGKVYYPFRNLAVGLHTITFKAWDVYNNPVNAEIQFVVVGDDDITLSNVLNYPNPFVSYTEFWFSHNKPFEPLEVQVQVMTITGKIVWTRNQIVTTDGFLSRNITWDGKDDFGDRIGKGVYVYKLTVRTTLSNKKAEKIEQLVIL